MAEGPRLELRTGQTLTMSPQLRQAIGLLTMTNLELAAHLDEALTSNPLLEREDDLLGQEPGDDTEAPDRSEADDLFGNDAPLDSDGLDRFHSDSGGGSGDDTSDWIERTVAAPQSAYASLEQQITLALPDPRDRLLGHALMAHLDEAGYLRADLADLAPSLGCDREDLERVILALQGLEPTGIFARDLAECLALQLAERNRLDPAMQALLEHLELLGGGRLKDLMRVCGVDQDDLTDMIAEIRALDPKPGLGLLPAPEDQPPPDITVSRDAEGGYVVRLNTETLPRVLLNGTLARDLDRRIGPRQGRTFLRSNLDQAKFLVRALNQRADTLNRVGKAIVTRQAGFLRDGIGGLKPMTLRDVAEDVELHESTVSRAVQGKAMATPRGTFPLKFFFTQAMASSTGGDSISAEAIRHRIKSLIDGENAAKPLSDDALAAALEREGMAVARRTVAKYREALGIASSSRRKRQKALG